MYIIVIVSQSHLFLLLLLLLDLTISILDSGGERRGEERRGKEEEEGGMVSWDLLRRIVADHRNTHGTIYNTRGKDQFMSAHAQYKIQKQ